VFSWPGLGLQLFKAIGSRDLPLVQGGVLFVSGVFVFLNLAVDVLYAFLDPRVRYQ
jgi:peptide/nickel transport system permease protein